ncbi:hypothetical protein F3157_10640 [Virgibacillus dakarensis]|uniref:hypothetical protein n=1 Tax=Virgibacillus dakarensis TaxID=1917889 RepID=UPI000B437C9F|nr:hypothetical protein [Virgibacillus dakarensis]MTW86113.1 hypothetical protein [Virgibacillus dakarensis]
MEQTIKKLKGHDQMLKNFIRIVIVLCTIGSACLLSKRSFVKYLPVTLFSSASVLAEILYFTVHKLWKVKGGPGSLICNTSILVLGPYFFGTLLSFQLSKGKLLKYALINIIADFIYAFPLIKLFKKLDFFKLKVNSIQFYVLIVTNAFLNFGFQKFYERVTLPEKTSD